MSKPSLFIGLFLWLISPRLVGQNVTITGHVSEINGNSLFAVNVYLEHQKTIGTLTNSGGDFILTVDRDFICKNEHLVISYVGFTPNKIALDSIDVRQKIQVVLHQNSQSLNEVIVEGRKSISKEFSMKEMDQMKIYLSPLASGDALKAIAMLPASTNTSETANPELRGSAANRTKVFLNGVPVNNPVRNSQINGIGFFSLFNTAILDNMRVYPSNPPLIYGNSSAGIIEIETQDSLEHNSSQVTFSLASVGINLSRKASKKSFFQIYGNYQFSEGYLAVNPSLNNHLKSFHSVDMGMNFHYKFNPYLTYNFYNYFISESSNVLLNLFTHSDQAKAKTIRDFAIFNVKYQKNKHSFWINSGSNVSHSQFSFGCMNSNNMQKQGYASINYKYLVSQNLYIQAGASSDFESIGFADKMPVFYYAMAPNMPNYRTDTLLKNYINEIYLYQRWKPFNRLIIGLGLRKNVQSGCKNDHSYMSYQVNAKFNFVNNHSLLVSMGKYFNTTEPNYKQKEFRLLQSKQIAFEYLFENNSSNINIAAYYKHELGDTAGMQRISGFEILVEHYITRSLKASISNTLLNSEIDLPGQEFENSNPKSYFFVVTMSYFNPKLVNMAIAWSNHKGPTIQPIRSAKYNQYLGIYEPFYDQNQPKLKLSDYNTINLTINRMFNFSDGNMVAFTTVNNLFNWNNAKGLIYHNDYTASTFDYYQKRSVYFGFVYTF